MANATYHDRNKLVDGYPVQEHPSYSIWSNMKARCQNPSSTAYRFYGARGITVCDRWVHFKNFAEDMGVRPSPEHTLDRIDGTKGYSLDNCRWATRTEQCLNRKIFANNNTGATSIIRLKNGRYKVRFDYLHSRYNVSKTFDNIDDALDIRDEFVRIILAGGDVSDYTERKARYDSTTGVRGITPHADGGFLVRVTVDGSRKYLGHFADFEAAKARLEGWKRENS